MPRATPATTAGRAFARSVGQTPTPRSALYQPEPGRGESLWDRGRAGGRDVTADRASRARVERVGLSADPAGDPTLRQAGRVRRRGGLRWAAGPGRSDDRRRGAGPVATRSRHPAVARSGGSGDGRGDNPSPGGGCRCPPPRRRTSPPGSTRGRAPLPSGRCSGCTPCGSASTCNPIPGANTATRKTNPSLLHLKTSAEQANRLPPSEYDRKEPGEPGAVAAGAPRCSDPVRGESLRPPQQVSRLYLGRGHAALVQPSTEVVQRERDLHVLVIDAEGGAGGLDAGAGQRDAASSG